MSFINVLRRYSPTFDRGYLHDYTYSSMEYLQDLNLNKVVAEATGLSVTTISKIIKEGNELKDEQSHINVNFKSPKNKQTRKKKIEVDSFTEGVIRRKITQFYTVYKQVPTLK